MPSIELTPCEDDVPDVADLERPGMTGKQAKSKKTKKLPNGRIKDKITQVGHVFRPNEQERQTGVFHLRYNTREDCYYQNGSKSPVVKGWRNGTSVAVNVTRRAGRRTDVGMEWAYLTRYAGCETGSMSWLFDFTDSGLAVDAVMVLTYSRTTPGGVVRYDMVSPDACWDAESNSYGQEQGGSKDLRGVRTLILVAYLDGNTNDQSQTQLSYQEWNCHGNNDDTKDEDGEDVFSFQVVIHLKPQDLSLCTCSINSFHGNNSLHSSLSELETMVTQNNKIMERAKPKAAKDKQLKSKKKSSLVTPSLSSSSSSSSFCHLHGTSENLSVKSAMFSQLNGGVKSPSMLSVKSAAIADQNCNRIGTSRYESCGDTNNSCSQSQASIRRSCSTRNRSETLKPKISQSEGELAASNNLDLPRNQPEILITNISQSESQLAVSKNNPDLPQEENIHSSLPCHLSKAKGNNTNNTSSFPDARKKKSRKKGNDSLEQKLPKSRLRKKHKRQRQQTTTTKLSRSQSAPLNYGFIDDDNVAMKDIISLSSTNTYNASSAISSTSTSKTEPDKSDTIQSIQNGTVLYKKNADIAWGSKDKQKGIKEGTKKTEKSVLVSMEQTDEGSRQSARMRHCILF